MELPLAEVEKIVGRSQFGADDQGLIFEPVKFEKFISYPDVDIK